MSQGRRRRIEVEQVGDVTTVRFLDKRILDEQNIQLIGEQMFGIIDDDGATKVLLDFENVDYLSSAALGKLITMNKKVKGARGQLKLCNIKPEIFEVFEITNLNKVFQIYENQQTALEAY